MTDHHAVSKKLDGILREAKRADRNEEHIVPAELVKDLEQLRALWMGYLQSPDAVTKGLRATEGWYTEQLDPAYAGLRRVLDAAYDQATTGKGKDRHVRADDQAFEHQPICELQRMYGTGGGFYQVGKKMEESQRLPKDQAIAELHGGIIYLAAAIIVREEQDE